MESAAAVEAVSADKRRQRTWKRLMVLLWRAGALMCCLVPALFAAPGCCLLWTHGGEDLFWHLLLKGLQWHGPAAIKFAQWASTRPDLLCASVCAHFAKLQSNVRPHSLQDTERMLTQALGPQWVEELEIDVTPIGSGCMAQVHRGRLLPRTGHAHGHGRGGVVPAAMQRNVVLKVMHPGAQQAVEADMEALQMLVDMLEAWVPSVKYLSMSEAVTHFANFLAPQTDLRVEASNLEAFSKKFKYRSTGRGLRVTFPQVLRPYVTSTVLMETFEEGTDLGDILEKRQEHDLVQGIPLTEVRERVGKLCMDAFMQMLFTDNFVHGDMHPGNILFRIRRDDEPSSFAAPATEAAPALPVVWEPELVVLDAGLSVRMTRQDRRNFVELFHAIVQNQGQMAGQLMVERSPGCRAEVLDEGAFVKGVEDLICQMRGAGIMLGKLKFGELFGRLLSLACQHRVKLETSFVNVAVSIIVLEGVGRQLHPLTDLLALASPLLAEAVTQKLW